MGVPTLVLKNFQSFIGHNHFYTSLTLGGGDDYPFILPRRRNFCQTSRSFPGRILPVSLDVKVRVPRLGSPYLYIEVFFLNYVYKCRHDKCSRFFTFMTPTGRHLSVYVCYCTRSVYYLPPGRSLPHFVPTCDGVPPWNVSTTTLEHTKGNMVPGLIRLDISILLITNGPGPLFPIPFSDYFLNPKRKAPLPLQDLKLTLLPPC